MRFSLSRSMFLLTVLCATVVVVMGEVETCGEKENMTELGYELNTNCDSKSRIGCEQKMKNTKDESSNGTLYRLKCDKSSEDSEFFVWFGGDEWHRTTEVSCKLEDIANKTQWTYWKMMGGTKDHQFSPRNGNATCHYRRMWYDELITGLCFVILLSSIVLYIVLVRHSKPKTKKTTKSSSANDKVFLFANVPRTFKKQVLNVRINSMDTHWMQKMSILGEKRGVKFTGDVMNKLDDRKATFGVIDVEIADEGKPLVKEGSTIGREDGAEKAEGRAEVLKAVAILLGLTGSPNEKEEYMIKRHVSNIEESLKDDGNMTMADLQRQCSQWLTLNCTFSGYFFVVGAPDIFLASFIRAPLKGTKRLWKWRESVDNLFPVPPVTKEDPAPLNPLEVTGTPMAAQKE